MVKLLAEKYDGIACEKNYHNSLLPELDKSEFPSLTYSYSLIFTSRNFSCEP